MERITLKEVVRVALKEDVTPVEVIIIKQTAPKEAKALTGLKMIKSRRKS